MNDCEFDPSELDDDWQPLRFRNSKRISGRASRNRRGKKMPRADSIGARNPYRVEKRNGEWAVFRVDLECIRFCDIRDAATEPVSKHVTEGEAERWVRDAIMGVKESL